MTLDQLAERLGLSKTTVSRALAGYADVCPKTRERVRLAAEQYGYRPNPLTTLGQPHGKVGRRLADIVADLIAGASPSRFQEIWQPQLIIRDSDGPCLSHTPTA